jgi:hypothetical protein
MKNQAKATGKKKRFQGQRLEKTLKLLTFFKISSLFFKKTLDIPAAL